LLAVLLYWLLFIVGTPGLRPIIGEVPAGSPAAQASMKSQELIVKVGDTAVRTWQDVRWLLLQQTLKSKTAQVEARSDSEESHLHLLDLSGVKTDESDILQQLGLTTFRPPWPARVGEILPDSAAAAAGLQIHDEVVAVNGITVSRWEDFTDLVRQNPGKAMTLKLLRGQTMISLRITPEVVVEDGKEIGRIGAAYVMTEAEAARYMVNVTYAPQDGLHKAFKQTWDTSVFSLKMLGGMITGSVSWKSISGPVTIGSVAGKSADAGWKVFIGFLAIVSISLGVLNLLPIPVLDGGHLLYYTIEIFKGSPVSDATMETGQRIGLALLGLLMACALYNDFNRFITG
jgi:regulator of sigma E protease